LFRCLSLVVSQDFYFSFWLGIKYTPIAGPWFCRVNKKAPRLSSRGQGIENRKIVELPLSGRNPFGFTNLASNEWRSDSPAPDRSVSIWAFWNFSKHFCAPI